MIGLLPLTFITKHQGDCCPRCRRRRVLLAWPLPIRAQHARMLEHHIEARRAVGPLAGRIGMRLKLLYFSLGNGAISARRLYERN